MEEATLKGVGGREVGGVRHLSAACVGDGGVGVFLLSVVSPLPPCFDGSSEGISFVPIFYAARNAGKETVLLQFGFRL